MLILPVVLGVLLRHVPSADTARVVDGRLAVDPIGVSFEIPAAWLHPGQKSGNPFRGCLESRPTTTRTIWVDPREFGALQNIRIPVDQEFSAVADSSLPFGDLVAHLGADSWGDPTGCINDLQMRVYVGDLAPEAIVTRVRTAGLLAAESFHPTIIRPDSDTTGWQRVRLAWSATYGGDFTDPANVEVFSRRVGSRTVTLVFMYESLYEFGVRRQELPDERGLILRTFRIR